MSRKCIVMEPRNGINGKRAIVQNNLVRKRITGATRVPKKAIIKAAMNEFAPQYDHHMFRTGHYEVMRKIFFELLEGMETGTRILDIGMGTGILFSSLIRGNVARIINIGLEKTQPIELTGIDFSFDMLMRGSERIMRRITDIENDVDNLHLKEQGIGLKHTMSRHEKHITEIILSMEKPNKYDLLKVTLLRKNAERLSEIEEAQKVNTVITSYCYHWWRGERMKKKIAEMTFNALVKGGNFLSIEEWPLMVTVNPENPATERIFNEVDSAATPVDLHSNLYPMFTDVNFVPVVKSALSSPILSLPIDAWHKMYGIRLQK